MSETFDNPSERRRSDRFTPAQSVRVTRAVPVVPITDAHILNASADGVALRTGVPLHVGDRLSFHTHAGAPPILAEVLACEPLDDTHFQVRCHCLLGGFARSPEPWAVMRSA